MTTTSRMTLLTDKLLASALPAQRLEYGDTRQVGLRARLGAGGRVTFAYRGRHASGRVRTVSIGTYPEISLKAARAEAGKIRAAFQRGDAPDSITAAQRARRQRKAVTLGELVDEYGAQAAKTKKIWQPSPKGRSDARRRIDNVFGSLVNRPVTDLSLADYAAAMRDHLPRKSHGKKKANGQISRGRAYLAPVLDWATGRKPFHKVGAARTEHLRLPDLRETHDPAVDDPTISGVRAVILGQDELAAVLPLMVYPAPKCLKMRLPVHRDLRPIALRFLLLTAARLNEMVEMRWRDVSFRTGAWHKPKIKSTKGGPRDQFLPLSDAALALLRSLPGCDTASPDELVFPNCDGGKLGNWSRVTSAIQRESKTGNWHRHDLRRTAATLMSELQVGPSHIDMILGHQQPQRAENVSASFHHYAILSASILKDRPNPQKTALDELARALETIEKAGNQQS